MIAEIIAVGTELLMGQIANTNAQFIAKKLSELGIDHYIQTVVGDNPQRLMKVTAQAESRADILIFTGGLGPTRDDLTKQTIAEYLAEPLIIDKAGKAHIMETFKGRVMTDNNKAMALRFENGISFPNVVGQAVGTAIQKNDRTYILLPGPPSEMTAMFQHYVVDYLLSMEQAQLRLNSRYLHYFGIGESQLAATIDDFIMEQTNPSIAIYFGDYAVTVRLTAAGPDEAENEDKLDELSKELNQRLGEYYYGQGEGLGLNQVLVSYLKDQNKTIAFAESFTGGLAAKKLVDVPGASAVLNGSAVTYTGEAKHHVLGVKQETLDTVGMVSPGTAIQMAEGARKLYNSDIAISFTGVAGPDPMEGKDVGTVYIGIAEKGKETRVLQPNLRGRRENIQYRSVYTAYFDVLKNK
ncbi:competence/damage-inducible protein A [Aerococcus agrisoli]|uniref:Putative competence-damage inducible protein n=1 Tax=Aerococcus agrisoli TaxID=2487350 RepID=A0A3N4GHW4_9LACT|nr:competence/damage-inducible protein A [Aerococcus agrisoli]RPA61298.1 competence/damage-inducible protein A [Aerococcus agrisoli]